MALVCQRCSSCGWYIAGLASKVSGCHGRTQYTTFSKVAIHETWMENEMGKKSSDSQQRVKCNGKNTTIDSFVIQYKFKNDT